MKQFFTWRWWLTIAALVGIAAALVVLVGAPGGESLADDEEPLPRRVDVIDVARRVDTEIGWQVRDGVSRNDAEVRLPDGRRFLLAEGTVGVDECTRIEQRDGCAFLADTLGDAVIWFALLDVEDPEGELRLPPIAMLLDGNTWARLSNGWEVPLLAVVERRCQQQTLSIGNFVDTFGDQAWTYLDLVEKEVSAVQCRRN